MRSFIALIAAVVVGAGGYALWQASISADVGAAAMAKVTCSCVFVDGRTLEACRNDNPAGFEQISASVDMKARTATGTVAGLVSRRATFNEGYGCTLEP